MQTSGIFRRNKALRGSYMAKVGESMELTAMLIRVPLYLIAIIIFSMSVSFAAAYDRDEALVSLINPHEQINEEGDILWKKCMICHLEVPEVKLSTSINDVKLRFEDDMKQMCFRCHPQRMHPGGGWAGQLRGRRGAPIHWIKPPALIASNMKRAVKQYKTVYLPLEPKTDRIFCATCHNPHERGLLPGRADWGADYSRRLRSAGAPICQFCHLR